MKTGGVDRRSSVTLGHVPPLQLDAIRGNPVMSPASSVLSAHLGRLGLSSDEPLAGFEVNCVAHRS